LKLRPDIELNSLPCDQLLPNPEAPDREKDWGENPRLPLKLLPLKLLPLKLRDIDDPPSACDVPPPLNECDIPPLLNACDIPPTPPPPKL
jgi:hypothetical protein